MVQRKRLLYINFLQTIGVLLVIIGHSLEPYVYTDYLGENFIINEKCEQLYKFIYSFHIPLFFFLYGYLFAYREQSLISWTDYTKKRFKRLIIPFYLFALFIWIPFLHFYIGRTNAAEDFLSFKDCQHLWFLPTLFIIGLIHSAIIKTPLRKHLILLLILLLLWQCNHYDRGMLETLYTRPINNIVYAHVGFMVATYITRAKEHQISDKAVLKMMCFLLGILFLINDFQLELKLSLNLQTIINNWQLNVFLPILKLSVIFKIMFLYTATKIILIWSPRLVDNKITQIVSENMLTIYLVHQGFNWIFYKTLHNTLKVASIYSITGIVILTLLASIIVAIMKNYVLEEIVKRNQTKRRFL